MLEPVMRVLVCPVCRSQLTLIGSAVGCHEGHRFDVARQGYVNLLTAQGGRTSGDSAPMVAARDRFFASEHLATLLDETVRLADEVLGDGDACVVDVGAGTGHYLGPVVDLHPTRVGIAADVSKAAAIHAARAHERIGSIVCDVWDLLPVRTGAVDLVLNVFAPRNGVEMHRILRSDGRLLSVTPTAEHLNQILEPLDLLKVDERKEERVRRSLGSLFLLERRARHTWEMELRHGEIETLVAMGPSARHIDPALLSQRIFELPEPLLVTGAVTLSVLAPR